MPRKPRHLSPDERELWAKVAHTTAPLAKPRRVPADKTAPKKATPATPAIKNFRVGEAAPAPSGRIDLAPSAAERVATEPLAMDKRAYKRLARGKLQPEARLDLHGTTLSQAHPILTSFILSSQAMGRRLVLVITGKGRGGREEDGPIPLRRGILRDQVPRWLRSAPCAVAVLQIAQAHASHGGEGAWYVYLRRPR